MIKYRQRAAFALVAELGGGTKIVTRGALTLGLAALFVWLLLQRLGDLDLAQMTLDQVAWPNWAAAAALTCLAFWAVGQYDAVLHCHFATGIDLARARRAGICAIAVSQTLGLGVITGAVLRWRMLPEQSLAMATRITLAVALSFLAGWAVVAALVLLILPHAPYREVAALVLLAAVALGLMCLIAPSARFRWPNGITLLKLVFFCALDMLAAVLGLFVLLPSEAAVSLAILLPAFLLAYGAGLVSGAPGGIGAFEVTLLALLPQADPALVLAGVLGWRLLYFVAPAVLGAVLAIIGPRPAPPLLPHPLILPRTGRPAEAGIHAQGEHGLIGPGRAQWLVGRRAHFLVGLFDPFWAPKTALDHLTTQAQAEARWPVIYKCGPALAARARAAGWACLICAREAVLDPRQFDLSHPSRANLRRKLRRAKAALVQTLQIDPHQHGAELDRIAADWALRHGGERGFSMGRYDLDYLAGQRVYLARHQGRGVAFISLHCCGGEWTLDVMRHGAAMADGTMHLLVQQAVEDAKSAGIARVSLAAVPQLPFGPLPKWLWRGAGLTQFKDSFAPRWEGRYLLTRYWIVAPLAALSIAAAIHAPLGRFAKIGPRIWRGIKYGFAPILATWQSKGERFL